MTWQQALNFIPAFTLAFFRLAGLMIMSPLFGSAKIPKRVKLFFAAVATLGMVSALPSDVVFPPTWAGLALDIGGELVFGLAMGSIVSFTFIAAQWAGEMIGQQIGFNLSETFDPQFGQAGSLVGDLYFMLTLVVFLITGGHRVLLEAVYHSFKAVPLLDMGMNQPLFNTFIDLFREATILAMRLAAPIFFTMLVVDLAMGCVGKAMPAFNIMTAGIPVRSIIGLIVLIIGVGITTDAVSGSLDSMLNDVSQLFVTGGTSNGG